MKRVFDLAFLGSIFGFVLLISGCADQSAASRMKWAKSGSIQVTSLVPEVATSPYGQFVGFVPVLPGVLPTGTWLEIKKDDGTLSLMNGPKLFRAFKAVGTESLKPGHYQILHKQRDALWYAPDTYFTARGLPVPEKEDRSRFRRGALGEYSLFIQQDLAIHSGPEWASEVNGLRVTEGNLAELYYALEVGAQVEID